MNQKWDRSDALFAQVVLGFDIFETDTGLQLQRIDCPEDGSEPRFKNDPEAWVHVWRRAKQGYVIYERALDHLLNEGPEEFYRIFNYMWEHKK